MTRRAGYERLKKVTLSGEPRLNRVLRADIRAVTLSLRFQQYGEPRLDLHRAVLYGGVVGAGADPFGPAADIDVPLPVHRQGTGLVIGVGDPVVAVAPELPALWVILDSGEVASAADTVAAQACDVGVPLSV